MTEPEPRAAARRSTLVRGVRLVPVITPRTHRGPVDVRIEGGVVTEVGSGLAVSGHDLVLEADGRWAMPGLWDHHVHLGQWARARTQLDLSGSADAGEVLRRLSLHLAGLTAGGTRPVVGYGYRSGGWTAPPSVADLDAVAAGRPVVLVSGDCHNGWLSSAALRLFGAPAVTGALEEGDWFRVLARLDELPGETAEVDRGYRRAVADAAAAGVVGIVDMELGAGYADWPARVADGIDRLRVRAATYPDRLEEVVAARLRTGDPLDATGLVTMGPLKIISDGSLNTRTARCCEPYPSGVAGERGGPGREGGYGRQNHSPSELVELLGHATRRGLRVAVHAVGDAAASTALDAFAATGAAGTVEHAQLLQRHDIARMARLRIAASVQPAHLLDDRALSERIWADRLDRCFPLRSLHAAGVGLRLGSDAPVAPLDPWLSMAAAVHRGDPDEDAWNPSESLTVAQALACSTDGRPTIAPGAPGDLVLLDHDPLAAAPGPADAARTLRRIRVAATLLGGRPTHLAM